MTSVLRRIAAVLIFAGALYAQPAILSVSPPSAPAGTQGLILTVTGSNFVGTSVFWNGVPLATAVNSSTQLTVSVPAWLLTNTGTASLVAVNNPGGFSSNPFTFRIGSQIQITTAQLPAAAVGVQYSAMLAATGGTAPYTWTLIGSAPPGLTLTPAGLLSGIPTTAGRFDFTAQATDASGQNGSQALSVTVALPSLTVATTSLPAATAGEAYSQTLAVAGGTAPYQWTASGLPQGLRIDAASGAISGVPAAAGSFNVTVQVSDATRANASRALTLTVNPAALAITTVSPLFNATVDTPYAQTLSAFGGMPPYQWSIVSGDTGGLTIDAASGALQGTPRTEGTFSFTVQVRDSAGGTASRAFSVTVVRPSLVITTGSLPPGSVGTPYSQTFTVMGGTAPYTWSLAAGYAPGLTVTSAGVLSGTPAEQGSFPIVVTARDAAGITGSRNYSVTIGGAALRLSSDAELPEATLSQEFLFGMGAIGGAPPYTWSANGLPEGLSIDRSTGLISGTPAEAGLFSFTVRVTDNAQATSVDLFRLRVNLPPAPSAQISGLPESAGAAQQLPFQFSIGSAYAAPIAGQALISFAPDAGAGDSTIQFASGGRAANFTIPAGTTDVVSAVPLALQTGTVAGTITVSVRLTAGGIDITPAPAPAARIRVERTAPVIQSARMVRTSNGISVEIVGYSTSREITQMSVTFAASGGQTLQNTTVTVPVESLFTSWFQDPAASQYGSQFFFSQPFTITGDASAVSAQSVTLTNRVGSATAEVGR
jgi:hypothetical protein